MPISQPTDPATHPIQSGQAFSIISGESPRYAPEIAGGHKGLEQALAQSGVKYEATDGNYGDDKAHSPVIVAYGLGRDQAMDLGRRMGQESIIFSNGGQHEFVYTNGPNAGQFHPAGPQPMQVFPSPPDDGLTTRIQNLGHVRFNFDHGKLLTVPRKGRNMSEEAPKSELTKSEIRAKLTIMLRGKIEDLSKSLTVYASREVAQNDDASVGDFRTNGSLSLQSSNTEWMTELAKTATFGAVPEWKRAAQKKKDRQDKQDRPEPRDAKDDEGLKDPQQFEKKSCDTCKSDMCKCGDLDKNTGKGYSQTSQTQRKKANAADRRAIGKLGTAKDVANFDRSNHELAVKRNSKTPVTKAEWMDELASKSEDFIDNKNANARPTSTDDAKAGGPRIKNVGAENHAVAPATKSVAGKLDEGSGGEITKGKGLKKDVMAEVQKNSAPPMAKPPTAPSTPGKPPQSKPKLPKAPALGKGALPMGAGDAAAHAMKTNPAAAQAAGAGAPRGAAATPAPKAQPRPAGDFDAAAFKPTGPVSSGLELATKPKAPNQGVVGPKPPAPGSLPRVR